jgi:hypothetical protein
MQRREGIPLTDLPGLDLEKAEIYVARNVHTLEELAALSDAQCQGIGHGTLTDREGARKLVTQRQLKDRDRMQRAVHEASATVGSKPAGQYAPSADLDFVKAEIAELKQSIADLAGLVATAKRSRGKSKAGARRQEAD